VPHLVQWPEDPQELGELSTSYRIIRGVMRSVTDTWFREITVVDADTIPNDRGVIFMSWHLGAMIDPLLMFSTIPGQLTFAAKHTLFKVPILGILIKAIGAKPVFRADDIKKSESSNSQERSNKNTGLIDTLSEVVSDGGRIAIYPEGKAHLEPHPVRVRSGTARIILQATREAREKNLNDPIIVPIGIHYTDQHRFRERATIQVNRKMTLPPLPGENGAPVPDEELSEKYPDDCQDRAWINEVTELIKIELHRSNHAEESWEDRDLAWKTRSMVRAYRMANSGHKISRPNHSESVLGARRVRAAWHWLRENDEDEANSLRSKMEDYNSTLSEYNLQPWEIQDRNKRKSRQDFVLNLVNFVWSYSWLFGIVTWGAMIGNLVPYYVTRILTKHVITEAKSGSTGEGSYKLIVSFAIYPIWWILASIGVGWILAADSSPIQNTALPGIILPFLKLVPWTLLSLLLLVWWPLSARLHLKLWSRAVRSWRGMKRWFKLTDDSIPWENLKVSHNQLASMISNFGDSLILPGDSDWKEPETGKEDWQVVNKR